MQLHCFLVSITYQLSLQENFKLEKIQPEGVSTFGKHFVLAYPGYNTPLPNAVNLRLMLYTYNVEEFYVTVSRRGSDWEDQADFLISSGQHYTLYEENDFVGFEPIAQTRWTNILKAAYTFSCLVYAFIPKLYHIVAYFHAVPVEGWGRRYTVITPSFRPSIQIVNGPMNQSITLYPNEAGKTELTKYFKSRDGYFKHSFVFHLGSEEALSIQLCTGELLHNTLTGTRLQANDVFGVISGNCFDYASDTRASKPECVPDIALEMQLPESAFATSFIVDQPFKWAGTLEIVFSTPTQVTILGPSLNTTFVSNRFHYSKRFTHNIVGLHSVKADMPILVALLASGECTSKAVGEMSVSLFVPTGLFLDTYFWVTEAESTFQHYVFVICTTLQLEAIKLDDIPLRRPRNISLSPPPPPPVDEYMSKSVHVKPGPHQLYSVNVFRFAAYLFGLDETHSTLVNFYMMPAGFVSKPGGPATCSPTTNQTKGDLIDNDCDGYVDEEKRDGQDNDGDDRIDEDIGSSRLTNGAWSHWSEWFCDSDFASYKERFRTCDNPPPFNGGFKCFGDSVDSELANCYDVRRAAVDGGWSIIKAECIDCKNGSDLANVTRLCNNPAPRNGGKNCTGRSSVIMIHPLCESCLHIEDHNNTTLFVPVEEDKLLHGVWGEWTIWTCMENCTISSSYRTRPCLDPPEGRKYFRCIGYAYDFGSHIECKYFCFMNCSEQNWGPNCDKPCGHCQSKCDRRTGRCTDCRPGYRDPETSCFEECPEYTYGFRCLGDCAEECHGLDCSDRKIGTCQAPALYSNLWYGLLLLLIIPVCIVLKSRYRGRAMYSKSLNLHLSSSRA